MECKFIRHGIALSYDQLMKPCCVWKISDDWRQTNHYKKIDIINWHKSSSMNTFAEQLANDQWPSPCKECEKLESQGRYDSMRGNGNYAYSDYQENDITLEIRPGNTCNFACQTCWPEASSRVTQYYNQAGLIDVKNINSNRIDDFDFLLPIADRIRDVVLLGGEPFYDKACLKFLEWAQNNLQSNIMMFTNGSIIDVNLLKNYSGNFTLVFSLDAAGRSAEYVRYGTVWNDVIDNYQKTKTLSNVKVRVNITCSVYNYSLIENLIDLLCEDWPEVVSFGTPMLDWLKESTIPLDLRDNIIISLTRAIEKIKKTNIEFGQQSNAINALNSIITNLQELEWNSKAHAYLCDFIKSMDQVKGVCASDYSEFLKHLLEFKKVA